MAEEDRMKPHEEPSRKEPSGGPEVVFPPGIDELIYDDGEPLESTRHRDGMMLLIESLDLYWADRTDYYVSGNMFLYFSMLQTRRNDFRGPDVFVVLGTERRERKAWVLWEEEGKRPSVVIELTSASTVSEDHGRKKDVYERALEVPYYFIFDPDSGELEGFHLPGPGARYAPIPPNGAGRLAVEILGLELGVWHGQHRYVEAPWLRWYLPDGTFLPSAQELAQAAQARADQENARADQEKARADQEKARADELERRLAAQVPGVPRIDVETG
jgi:Uma2 family endonuclease